MSPLSPRPTNYPSCPTCGSNEGWLRDVYWRSFRYDSLVKTDKKGQWIDTPEEARLEAFQGDPNFMEGSTTTKWSCRHCEAVPLISVQQELDIIFERINR